MPRPKKYDWDDKRDICCKLWVEDKLSGTEIVQWFSDHLGIPKSELPNSHQFHHYFRKWGFPLRRESMPAQDEERLLARAKELWSGYATIAKIQETLNEEGWEMDNYKFRVFRRKHGMLNRHERGYKPKSTGAKRKGTTVEDELDVEEGAGEEHDAVIAEANGESEMTEPVHTLQDAPPLAPEEAARRAQRLIDLQIQSDELMLKRKRRRRIRGYGHLPADEPGLEPRYGSETSLDECKAFLQLSNELYISIRRQFDAICRETGVIKMSLCAEGEWQAVKDRLVRENMHLSSVLHPLQPDIDRRSNALNVICMDVTKKIRDEGKKLTIASASNILDLDPVQSKEVRRVFYELLAADRFTTVVACGKERLDELKNQWYTKCDVLRQAIATGDPEKQRAVDVLNKDARKRYCDDQLKHNPEQRQWQNQKHYGPGPGPAKGAARKTKPTSVIPPTPSNAATSTPSTATSRPSRIHQNYPLGPAWAGLDPPVHTGPTTIADIAPHIDFLDPLLSGNIAGSPWPSQQPPIPIVPITTPAQTTVTAGPDRYPPPTSHPGPAPAASAAITSIPVYFRLSTLSQITGHHVKMWLGKLTSDAKFSALVRAATAKAGAASVGKISGVVKNAEGGEDSWVIENDDELAVYLEEAGEKPTFVVVLMGGYA